MYELIQVGELSYYFRCPAKIGLVKMGEDQVCLIDSGNDKSAGTKVRKELEARGWRLEAVYNTHSHADHIGGNRYLQGQTGCRIFAPGIECDFTRHPVLEPSYLFGGNPPKGLRHKFLMAQPSDVSPLTEKVLPAGWEMIPLPGHSFDMVGFRIPDGTVYLADCLSSPETLEKYQINFLTDVEAYLNTLERVETMESRIFVPSHAEETEDIEPLARKNIEKVFEIKDRILEQCREPVDFDSLLKGLFDVYGLRLSLEQYVLVGSTIKSYLTWLQELGEIQAVTKENRLLWYRA